MPNRVLTDGVLPGIQCFLIPLASFTCIATFIFKVAQTILCKAFTVDAVEFGRVDELAKGQLGLASVRLETTADLNTALTLVNEAIESFQQQGMQYEIQKSRALRDDIMKAQSPTVTPQQQENG